MAFFIPQNLIVHSGDEQHHERGIFDKDVRLYDADGNPIDITGTPTTIPHGALVPGSGINLARGENGAITVSIPAKAVTAGMLADGVTVSGPKGDKGDTGPAGPKGDKGDAATLTAATKTALGAVRQAAFVADPAGDTVTKAEFIALRDALVAAGAMAPKS